jgi:hypothetical protein
MRKDSPFCGKINVCGKINAIKWIGRKLGFNGAESMTLFTFEICLETFEVKANENDYDDYDDEYLEFAELSEWCGGSCIYAESGVSAEEACKLVYEKCLSLSKLYTQAAQSIDFCARKEKR